MSDALNPYQSPETKTAPEQSASSNGWITDAMFKHLKAASPWMKFIGICGFVVSGLTAITGIFYTIAIPFFSRNSDNTEFYESFELLNINFVGGPVIFGIAGIFMLITAGLGFLPSLFLFKAGQKIRSYLMTGKEQHLELALKNNKSFWKFAGIVTIVSLAFIPVAIIIVVILSLASVLS